VITDLTDELTAPLQLAADDRDLRSILVELGERCLDVSLRPSSLAFHRLIISAAARFPDLGPAVFAAGASRMLDDLARLIERRARNDGLVVGDAREAAEQFFGMLTGFDHFRALLGVARADKASRRKRVARTVDAFLGLYRSPAAPGRRSARPAATPGRRAAP
jgi:TetR/AcrR family transcriptional repressor of mexJK operon